jgi:hypothetical protein
MGQSFVAGTRRWAAGLSMAIILDISLPHCSDVEMLRLPLEDVCGHLTYDPPQELPSQVHRTGADLAQTRCKKAGRFL